MSKALKRYRVGGGVQIKTDIDQIICLHTRPAHEFVLCIFHFLKICIVIENDISEIDSLLEIQQLHSRRSRVVGTWSKM